MQPKYPELSERIQSSFIDGLFSIALIFACSAGLEKAGEVADEVRIGLFVLIFIAYEPVCTSLGCTLGNYIKGIRVRNVSNPSHKINFLQALIRYVVKIFMGWLSFITIHFNPQKRAMHDLAAGSLMIKLDK